MKNDQGHTSYLGSMKQTVMSEMDVEKSLMSQYWDARLDSAGCSPVFEWMGQQRPWEKFLTENREWIDEVAEANDNLGSFVGLALTKRIPNGAWSPLDQQSIVQLVFDHGIVEADVNSLELLANRVIHRLDEL